MLEARLEPPGTNGASLGPFTAPSNCFDDAYTVGSDSFTPGSSLLYYSPDSLYAGPSTSWTPGYYITRGFSASCYPPEVQTSLFDRPPDSSYIGWVLFDTTCAGGFTVASEAIVSGETASWCCPSSWSIDTALAINYYTNYTCTGRTSGFTVVSGDSTQFIQSSASVYANGFMVVSGFFDNLNPNYAPATTSSAALGASSAASPGSSGPSLPTSTSDPFDWSGPSPSTVRKIAISSSLAGFAAVGLLVAALIWIRRRKKKKAAENPTADSEKYEKSELPGKGKERGELGGTGRSELESGKPGELPDGDLPAELDSGWQGWEAPTASATRDAL